ncbi:lanthionine synthetase LanC family protein [Saccharopolyspora spinosporotrichia]
MTDELVTRHVAELLARERARLDAGIPGAPIRAYDVISGASGIGRYLLLHPRHHTLLRHLLAYLVRLTAPVAAHGVTVPGWWVSTVPNPARPHDFPCGRLNLGLAHGICGPMTLLAFARQAGIRVPGDDEAIASIAEELLTYQDERGQWPGTVALEDIVLDGENDPVEPGLCHGRAGALHLTSVLAHDTGDARLVAQLPGSPSACWTFPPRSTRFGSLGRTPRRGPAWGSSMVQRASPWPCTATRTDHSARSGKRL